MHGLLNAIYGTLFTWGVTALGAACVLIVPGKRRDVLDASLGLLLASVTSSVYL